MMDDANPEDRVALLERQLAEMRDAHRAALVRAGLRVEATRAGMIDLDGLKMIDAGEITLDDSGEVVGAAALMTTVKRAKPWLFGLPGVVSPLSSSSSTASAPPAQPPKARSASDMTYEEWQAARAELLRRI